MEEKRKAKNIKATQLAQNKLQELLNASRVKDKRSIQNLLVNFKLLSINQTTAQMKLIETWKASRDKNYPSTEKDERNNWRNTTHCMRPTARKEMREGGKTKQAEKSFVRDSGKIWNQAPMVIKEAKSIAVAKKLIKKYYKTLPI